MYAVIFKGTVRNFDADYAEMATRLHVRATTEFGCTGFSSCTEGDEEISISYWPSEEHIKVWKQDGEHLQAQENGRSRWYKSYIVEVVKIEREYSYS
ncbi:MAG: antibiotic biosynthesis monooxygenase [Gammaproteobacteria bacterium]|nr:antibiotic biosynthesis monooxygenase [Gammaproteobacteria bacterium]